MQVGSCYLISSLQCQAVLLPQLRTEDTLVAWNIEIGVYAVRFWHLGKWKVQQRQLQLRV